MIPVRPDSLIETHTPRRSFARPAGFTLVELIAILVIVGVMAGVAIPTLGNLGSTRAGMAAKQLLRDITYARQRALATGANSWVVFDTAAKTWTIMAENPASPGRAGAAALTDMATGQAYTTTLGVNNYVGVNMTSCNFDSATEIGFDWLGKPLNSTGASLIAQGSVVFNTGCSVTVQPVTGHAKFVP